MDRAIDYFQVLSMVQSFFNSAMSWRLERRLAEYCVIHQDSGLSFAVPSLKGYHPGYHIFYKKKLAKASQVNSY